MTIAMTDSLVMDIGAGTGALVVYAPEELVGREIEIARDGASMEHPVHNVVRRRRIGLHTICAAVFPALAAGTYVPYGDPQVRTDPFTVRDGRVTEVEWRRAYRPCRI